MIASADRRTQQLALSLPVSQLSLELSPFSRRVGNVPDDDSLENDLDKNVVEIAQGALEACVPLLYIIAQCSALATLRRGLTRMG